MFVYLNFSCDLSFIYFCLYNLSYKIYFSDSLDAVILCHNSVVESSVQSVVLINWKSRIVASR